MSHTITIKRLPDETSDDAEYTIGGECDRRCGVWRECKRKACQSMNVDYPPFDERYRHEAEHQHIENAWMVETGECGLQFADNVGHEAERAGELGTFDLNVEWDGGGWFSELGARKRLGVAA